MKALVCKGPYEVAVEQVEEPRVRHRAGAAKEGDRVVVSSKVVLHP